jgi:putative Mn2+ efflux pump MntP
VVAVAVFDVAKFLMEEQVIRQKEVKTPEESKKQLTKFMTIIVIAVMLEALVIVFEASKTDVTTLIYPTLLLLAGVAIVVGLGFYQKLSTIAQKTTDSGGSKDASRRNRYSRDQNSQR